MTGATPPESEEPHQSGWPYLSGWPDLNRRPPRPERGALTKLRYTPWPAEPADVDKCYRPDLTIFASQ